MDYKEYVAETICVFEEKTFQSTRDALVGDYLTFAIIEKEDVTRDILAEKICDYFEKIELEENKPFDKQVRVYMDNLDSIIKGRVAETPKKSKKDAEPAEEPRARKYYNRALEIKDSRNMTLEKMIDFSRIMLCLYVAAIDCENKHIEDFEFSADCLDQDRIIIAMKKERKFKLPIIGARGKFDVKDLYSMDTCTFVLTILMLQTIANERAWWNK